MSVARKTIAISCAWLAWVFVVAILTAKLLLWQINYFQNAGPLVYRSLWVFLFVLVFLAFGYARLRQRGLWKFEPAAFAVFAAGAMLAREPKAAVVSIVILLSANSVGAFVANRFQLKLPGPIDRIIVRCGLGFGFLIAVVTVAGQFGLLYRGTFALILLAPIAFWHRDAGQVLSDLRLIHAGWKNAPELRHPMVGVGIAFGFIALFCSVVVALAPSMIFDALAVHLPSVQHYVLAHNILPIPQIPYSYYPQGGEALWTMAYSLAGQAGAQMLSVLFFALFLMVVFRLARECGAGRAGAVVGTFWTATIPFLHWTGSVVKNDMIFSFFQALALFAVLRFSEQTFAWIAVSVFFMAQSFGVKHVALFGSVPLSLFYAHAVWKQPRRWRAATVVVLIFLLFGTFWTIRTYLLTGNPAYPAASSHAVSGAALGHEHPLTRILRMPWTIVSDGRPTFESPLLSPAGIVLLAFFPLAFIATRAWRNTKALTCVAFVVIYLGYWLTILSTLRYAIVPIAIMTVLLAQAATLFYAEPSASLVRRSILAVEVYCLLFAAVGTMIIEINLPGVTYLVGRIDKAAYLRAALPTFRSLEYLKGVAKPEDTVFGIDNCSRAYAPNPLRFQCVLCADGSCAPKELETQLKQNRPRYLIVPEVDTPSGAADVLSRYSGVQIFTDGHFGVYELSK